jgi:hypothetical protein
MQTRCPKCSTTVRSCGSEWTISHPGCTDLLGTQWAGRPEYCPLLSTVVAADVALPGLATRDAIAAANRD